MGMNTKGPERILSAVGGIGGKSGHSMWLGDSDSAPSAGLAHGLGRHDLRVDPVLQSKDAQGAIFKVWFQFRYERPAVPRASAEIGDTDRGPTVARSL